MRELPSKDDLLAWIRDNPGTVSKREIAQAFGVTGSDRAELKRMLRALEDHGEVRKERRRVRPAGTLPPVGMIEIRGPDPAGDLAARPLGWDDAEGPAPSIVVRLRPKDPVLGAGDRVLARLTPTGDADYPYSAEPIRKISEGPERILGIYRATRRGGRIEPIDKRAAREWQVPVDQVHGAQDGMLVEVERLSRSRVGLPLGRVVAIHGDPSLPGMVSLIAMVQHQIPHIFPADVLGEAEAAQPLDDFGGREDLRTLPLLTIDPSDARDHDDAVAALPDPDPDNPGGYIVWVAIADVAHYVRPGSALDREALLRGNSTYFPDRVSPMLPETLSADLCSLHVGVDRPCMAVAMTIAENGAKRRHRFCRGIMRSAASLDYETAQAVLDAPDTAAAEALAPGLSAPLGHLAAAYRAVWAARTRREPLDLDLPERRIALGEDGKVAAIGYRERLDTHRLIEEFMILANVAAAETLEAERVPLLYRVHEEPNPEKLDALRETLSTAGLSLARGQVLTTRDLNQLLAKVRGTDNAETVSMSVLRAQTQAFYAAQNLGHFGLNLPRYAHFTSPIRRYADLIVHRALITALSAGDDGLSARDVERLARTAEDISVTERRSMDAERDTVDRYVASYLSDRTGDVFGGKIAGVARGGLFVRLDETGADGLVPISTIGGEYYLYDQSAQTLTGDMSGQTFALGMRVEVRLIEATPSSGGLLLELISVEGQDTRQGRGRRPSSRRRTAGKAKTQRAKMARKAKKRP